MCLDFNAGLSGRLNQHHHFIISIVTIVIIILFIIIIIIIIIILFMIFSYCYGSFVCCSIFCGVFTDSLLLLLLHCYYQSE